MATFESKGHTVFRKGDPAIPDIAAEKRGVSPSAPRSGSKASDLLPKRPGIFGRALRMFSRRGDRSEGRRYELDGAVAARLKEEADGRGATEREVLEEAVRLYLAGRRGGVKP